MSAQLICFDCHIWRRVVAPVVDRQTISGKVVESIVGWRCKKCVSKLYVGGATKSSEGQGWRRRFNQLVTDIKDQAQKKMAPAAFIPVQPNQQKVVKKSLVNKIASFFKRRTM